MTRFSLRQPLVYATALMIAAVTIVPVAYVVLGGFRTNGQVSAHPVGWPSPWITKNYLEVLASSSFWTQVANSTIVAVGTTLLVVALGVMAAFGLSRYTFRGREALYLLFTLGLLFPIGVAILPLYLLLRDLNMLDSLLGVILPQAAFGLPVTIVILRPFIRGIPGELEDAAVIDGCSRVGFFWRILLPLSGPGLVTVGVLAFVGSWNAYLLPLLVLNDPASFTLPLGVAAFSTAYTQDTAKILAFTSLSILPALAFFLAFERRIVGGLTGAVKG
ncbi:carbohydrate ABC transporter permease [Pengzhenrongella sp.]|jgi:raffinose/stachyose/melibiose transport system permease protein|uniref:carbohydrate ABC transporter permease n=1 Tax=Pengzhenrongella sp. TaxID=2888820 RepID=UPI002F91FB7F